MQAGELGTKYDLDMNCAGLFCGISRPCIIWLLPSLQSYLPLSSPPNALIQLFFFFILFFVPSAHQKPPFSHEAVKVSLLLRRFSSFFLPVSYPISYRLQLPPQFFPDCHLDCLVILWGFVSLIFCKVLCRKRCHFYIRFLQSSACNKHSISNYWLGKLNWLVHWVLREWET
jgi:hypothetical protein